ncbi:sulfakinin receptor-like protein [Euroglyphus maynei]|uniref:Sulfakinin receptor-like protein n=1 Tax=Euroglyphus maynei TaxID=6958 RepID=A0A1Y3BH30_EURMA|nr:sulfakinin receptor-like protein [Euroglyphus maynei]
MSIERYYAICHPFRSRESRQTKKHAYRILAMNNKQTNNRIIMINGIKVNKQTNIEHQIKNK